MSKQIYIALAALVAALVAQSIPGAALAATQTLIVSPSATYTSIQAAVNKVRDDRTSNPSQHDTYIIQVQSQSTEYTGAVTIDGTTGIEMSDITIVGTSTQNTVVKSGVPSKASFTITGSNASGISIRHFTFISNSAISISGGASNINITNNVFTVGTSNAAIQVADATLVNIVNNTFYLNGTAIDTSSNLLIDNNIFSNNNTAISGAVTTPNVKFNDFFLNTNIGFTTIGNLPPSNIPTQNQESDPKFQAPGSRDFHLGSGSAASGTGDINYPNPGSTTTSDMGAYGGPNAELSIPQVTIRTATVSPTGSTFSVDLTWTALTSSVVTGYRVHYGTASGSYMTTKDVSGQGSSSFTLQNLSGTDVSALDPPTITSITPANGSLIVHWTAIAGATNYLVYWNEGADFTDASLPATFREVGNVQTFSIPNLTNGKSYFVRIVAKAQTTYFFAVGALAADGSEGPLSSEVSALIGNPVVSLLSASVSQMPSASVAYPYLKGEGCFIATAAYGFYSAWQVQALRDFRDRYLITNGPGRAFVNWYYHYGPIGAHYLNQHPVWKPLVRVLLFPLVVGAIFLTATSSVTKVVVLALLLLASTVLFRRKAAVRWGGVR